LRPNTLSLDNSDACPHSAVFSSTAFRFLAIGMIALGVAGCQTAAGLAPVSGKITLDGKPLANAHIVFQPATSSNAPSVGGSYAFTNEKGEYTLRTFEGDHAGAALGTHKVQINLKIDTEKDPASRTRPKLLPTRYNVLSELTFDVKRGGTTAANFNLTSK
jgi:hypothetical protein